MKDLAPLKYFLVLEVHMTSKEIFFLNRHNYTTNLITLVGLADTTHIDTPMEVNLKLCKERDLSDPYSIAI